jgi:hypothetical protein
MKILVSEVDETPKQVLLKTRHLNKNDSIVRIGTLETTDRCTASSSDTTMPLKWYADLSVVCKKMLSKRDAADCC